MSAIPLQFIPPPGLPPGMLGVTPIGLLPLTVAGASGVVPPLPSAPAPPPTQHIILLTHLPSFLSDHKSLRELTTPCGASRGITVCQTPNIGCVAIVRMSTSSGATALVKTAPVVLKEHGVKAYYPKELQKRVTQGILKSNSAGGVGNQQVVNVPFVLDGTSEAALQVAQSAIPDTPNDLNDTLAPTEGDSTIESDNNKTTLIDRMTEASDLLKARQSSSLGGFFLDSVRKLDVSKVAAAAGGGAYDEDVDPLNAPEVLEAVSKFKKALEERDIKNKRKRQEIVDTKLTEAVDHYKRERKRMLQQAGSSANSSSTTNNAPSDVKDSGKRGISNLPAWMTQSSSDTSTNNNNSELQLSTNNNLNKKELTLEMLTAPDFLSTFWKSSPLPSHHEPTLHTYITSKIKNLLGEEESTLIEFLFQNTIKSKMNPQSLIDELYLVLEDDANKFVLDLYCYIQTLLDA